MASLPIHLQDFADFSPGEDFENFLKRVPAKGAVYLLTDSANAPVQLLCVQNLRNSLKHRLGCDEFAGPSKRVNYREFVSRVHWRRVDSAFEADWIYYEVAREVFPQTYKGMVGFRPAWFIHVDPEAKFPRYTKTIDLTGTRGMFLGPLEDKHAAARWIETVEDLFDLCRFHNILIDSPLAKACAYKEMGKCPAPCDGSISMDAYRSTIAESLQFAINPATLVEEQTGAMQEAASQLRFELAAKIKAFLIRLSELGKGPFRLVKPLAEFQYISLQRGPREKTAKVFWISRGQIQEVFGLIAEPLDWSDIILQVAEAVERSQNGRVETAEASAADQIGVVAHHMFSARQSTGVFLPAIGLDEKILTRAYRDLQKQKIKTQSDEEGLVKELQAM